MRDVHPVILEAAAFLHQQMADSLRVRGEAALGSIPAATKDLMTREAILRTQIDRAFEHLLELGNWPDVAGEVVLLMEIRLSSAHKVLQRDLQTSASIGKPDPTDLKVYLRELLIGDWRERGAKKWRLGPRRGQ